MLLGELNAGSGESTTPLIGWDCQKIHSDSLSQNNHVQVLKAVVVTQECLTFKPLIWKCEGLCLQANYQIFIFHRWMQISTSLHRHLQSIRFILAASASHQ